MSRFLIIFILIISVILLTNITINAARGDITGDFMINMFDIIPLRSYVFNAGPAPNPLSDANVDGYGTVNIADVVYLENYVYAFGPGPSCIAPESYTPAISTEDIVRIGNPKYDIYPGGDSMAIPIHLTIATAIKGFTFGFQYSTSEISVTSINTTGAVVVVTPNYDLAGGKIQLSYAETMGTLSPQPEVLLVTLNAQIITPGVDQYVDIDSSYVPPAGDFIFVTSDASVFCPQFVKATANTECCQGIRGNFDSDELDEIDIGDLVFMVEFQFDEGTAPLCLEEADIAPILSPDGSIDIGDLVAMVEFQFEEGPPPVDCP